MLNILQITIDRKRSAQDLIAQTSVREKADLIIVSEPNKVRARNSPWFRDTDDDVCIIKKNRSLKVYSSGRGKGYVWVSLGNIFIYGVYISPNVDLVYYSNWLATLAQDVRSKQGKIVIAGDFNARSPLWGSPSEDRRGTLMADWISSANLTVLNTGEATFERGTSLSHIDISLATEDAAPMLFGWSVLEEDSLSLHKYIKFSIRTSDAPKSTSRIRRGVDKNKLRKLITNDAAINNENPELEDYLNTVRQANKTATIWDKVDARGNPVYWWTDEIESQRRELIRVRRHLQRSRVRADSTPDLIETALEQYRSSRNKLSKMIRREKAQRWSALCKDLYKGNLQR